MNQQDYKIAAAVIYYNVELDFCSAEMAHQCCGVEVNLEVSDLSSSKRMQQF